MKIAKLIRKYLAYIPRIGKKDIKRLDIVVIGLYVGALVLLSYLVISRGTSVAQVEIKTEKDIFVYQLEKDRALTFDGPLGQTSVQIAEGRVSVLDSPGRLKICIKAGEIYRNGQWLACLPNRIFIRIVQDSNNDLDAITF